MKHRRSCKRGKRHLAEALPKAKELYHRKKARLARKDDLEEIGDSLPMHFRDMLPELPMPLPPTAMSSLTLGNKEPSIAPLSVIESNDPSVQFQPVEQPWEVQSCRSALPVPPRALFKLQSNSFGLFHVYDVRMLPYHNPVLNEPTGEHVKVDKPDGTSNPFHPYPNESSMHLGEWYWNQCSLQNKSGFKRLLSIVGSPDFDPEDIRNMKWTTVDCELGELENKTTVEWLNECDGWKKTSISINAPFHQCFLPLTLSTSGPSTILGQGFLSSVLGFGHP
ncbi:hypothetical protein SCLCIDRAFT_1174647 [Scleroderma citrinum Foug A]|uniref:Uncharacterized protein n=1 Tax=Scleroderma citrinum Foug A TaxID=1036808 RepID=A0A0C2ZNQ6_9AGAM|nr:hypothetical protein SCLCIDRAFT_1174647 [Scleroderma citrinum Foug A]